MALEREKWAFVCFGQASRPEPDGGLPTDSVGGYVMAVSREEAYGMATLVAQRFLPAKYNNRRIHLIEPSVEPIWDVAKASLGN